jgi:hypothetical protein
VPEVEAARQSTIAPGAADRCLAQSDHDHLLGDRSPLSVVHFHRAEHQEIVSASFSQVLEQPAMALEAREVKAELCHLQAEVAALDL